MRAIIVLLLALAVTPAWADAAFPARMRGPSKTAGATISGGGASLDPNAVHKVGGPSEQMTGELLVPDLRIQTGSGPWFPSPTGRFTNPFNFTLVAATYWRNVGQYEALITCPTNTSTGTELCRVFGHLTVDGELHAPNGVFISGDGQGTGLVMFNGPGVGAGNDNGTHLHTMGIAETGEIVVASGSVGAPGLGFYECSHPSPGFSDPSDPLALTVITDPAHGCGVALVNGSTSSPTMRLTMKGVAFLDLDVTGAKPLNASSDLGLLASRWRGIYSQTADFSGPVVVGSSITAIGDVVAANLSATSGEVTSPVQLRLSSGAGVPVALRGGNNKTTIQSAGGTVALTLAAQPGYGASIIAGADGDASNHSGIYLGQGSDGDVEMLAKNENPVLASFYEQCNRHNCAVTNGKGFRALKKQVVQCFGGVADVTPTSSYLVVNAGGVPCVITQHKNTLQSFVDGLGTTEGTNALLGEVTYVLNDSGTVTFAATDTVGSAGCMISTQGSTAGFLFDAQAGKFFRRNCVSL